MKSVPTRGSVGSVSRIRRTTRPDATVGTDQVELKTIHTAEPVLRLLTDPCQHTHRVIAVAQDVVTGRQAVLGTVLLHLVQLLHIELVIPNNSPVVGR